MDDFFSRTLQELIGREHGPMNFRLLIQPLIAAFLAVRAGLRDARAGRPPFFWSLTFDAAHREDMLRQGWKDIAKVFVAALVLDVVYQLMALKFVYPVQAVIVATVLAVVPYLLLRAPVTRLFGKRLGAAP